MSKKSQLSKYLAELGHKGGTATARKLTPEERSESARKAAKARWTNNKNNRRKATED
jgi:general stress protein YciG